MGSRPKIEQAPAPVTFEESTDEQKALDDREKQRRRLASAVNSRSSILTGTSQGGGKTLLGQ